MRRRQYDMRPIADMNLTNLLDVVFVLLTAFMLVAPTLNNGLEIDLPKVVESKPLEPKKPVMVSIKKRSDPEGLPQVFLDGMRVSLDDLKKRLSETAQSRIDVNVIVQCDENEQSGILLQTIGAIQGAGIEKIGLQTEPQ